MCSFGILEMPKLDRDLACFSILMFGILQDAENEQNTNSREGKRGVLGCLPLDLSKGRNEVILLCFLREWTEESSGF